MFDFQLDADARIVRATTSGFWDAGEAQAFSVAYQRHAELARERWNVVRILVDGSRSPVQAGDVTKAYEGLNGIALQGPHDRVAIVVAAGLVKMQAKRVLSNDGGTGVGNLFESIADAEAWLRAAG